MYVEFIQNSNKLYRTLHSIETTGCSGTYVETVIKTDYVLGHKEKLKGSTLNSSQTLKDSTHTSTFIEKNVIRLRN